TVLLLSRNKDHVARSNRAHALIRFYRRLACNDEIEVLAVLVQMERRRGVLFVMHNASQHVVNVGELLIDEKDTFARPFGVDQRGQLALFENIGHFIFLRYFAVTSGVDLRRAVDFLPFVAPLLVPAANAAETNAVSPSHGSTSTSALAP